PKSPSNVITSPGFRRDANFAANFIVSTSDPVCICCFIDSPTLNVYTLPYKEGPLDYFPAKSHCRWQLFDWLHSLFSLLLPWLFWQLFSLFPNRLHLLFQPIQNLHRHTTSTPAADDVEIDYNVD